MSLERPIGPGAEPPPTTTRGGPSAEGAPDAMRLQILSTEHWSLLASRSLAWNEAFSRAGMFLSVLSGAIVALALAAQADDFGDGFRLFALVILPVVLMVGIGTILRLRISNYHDAICVIGMNRIRAGYLEHAPGLERFFVMGTTDDQRGVSLTMAVAPSTSILVQMLASTPFTVMLLNAILAAAIGALLVIQVGGGTAPALAVAALAFAITLYAFVVTARRSIDRSRRDVEPIFPTQDGEAA